MFELRSIAWRQNSFENRIVDHFARGSGLFIGSRVRQYPGRIGIVGSTRRKGGHGPQDDDSPEGADGCPDLAFQPAFWLVPGRKDYNPDASISMNALIECLNDYLTAVIRFL
jgi:hypothetical protein